MLDEAGYPKTPAASRAARRRARAKAAQQRRRAEGRRGARPGRDYRRSASGPRTSAHRVVPASIAARMARRQVPVPHRSTPLDGLRVAALPVPVPPRDARRVLRAPRRSRNAVLLVASLAFYTWGEARYVPLVLGSVAFNWWIGMRIADAAASRAARGAGSRRPSRATCCARRVQVRELRGREPGRDRAGVGRGADARWRRSRCRSASRSSRSTRSRTWSTSTSATPSAQRSARDFALYILLFPQLIAGPIIRWRDIADQIVAPRRERRRIRLWRPPLRARSRQEGADREHARPHGRCHLRAARRRADARRSPGSGSSATRCRSISISPATRTWRSG